MEIHEVSDRPCPPQTIGIATNNNSGEQHCGVIYTSASGAVRLCDLKWEDFLAVRDVPNDYLWVKVALEEYEVVLISEFVEFIIRQHHRRLPIPYSFLYGRDAFDVAGRLRTGVGLTCATFIVGIFDRFKLFIVDLTSWRARPTQDAAFRNRIIKSAEANGYLLVAARLRAESPDFRLKPWELCSSATHPRYPVKFRQATKLAKTMSKIIGRKGQKDS